MNFGSMSDMIFIFLLALVIFGPKKLPEIGRLVGRALNDFKRASAEFRTQLEDEIRQLDVKEQILAEKKNLENSILSPTSSSPVLSAPTEPVGHDALPANHEVPPANTVPQFESCAEVVMPALPANGSADSNGAHQP